MRAKIISHNIFKAISKHVPTWDRIHLHRISLPGVQLLLSPNSAQSAFPRQGKLIHLVLSFYLLSSTTSDSLHSTSIPAPHFLFHGMNFSQFIFKKKWHLHCHDMSLISFMLSSRVILSLLSGQRNPEYMGQTHFSACTIYRMDHEVDKSWLCASVSSWHIQVAPKPSVPFRESQQLPALLLSHSNGA